MYINFSNYKIDSYKINNEGLTITYFKADKEMHLMLNPEQACEMLKKTKVIEHFEMYKDAPIIVWEQQQPHVDYYGNFQRGNDVAWMEWVDFVKEVKGWESYNGLTMQHIVELHEASKVLNQFIGFIESIGGKVSVNQ